MNLRKIIVGIVMTFLLSTPFAIVSAHETTAEHAEEHQVEALIAQISALLEIITSLQEQIAALQGTTPATNTTLTPFQINLTRNLTIGDRGADVKMLQRFLNTDPRTRIAMTGDGSPGNETEYFGNLTAQAVIAFQELYRDDILTPVGLVNGSGYVGPSTRNFMNQFGTQSSLPPSATRPANILPPSLDGVGASSTQDNSSQVDGSVKFDTANLPENKNKELLAKILETGQLPSMEEFSEPSYGVGSFSTYEASPGTVVEVKGFNLKNSLQIQLDANTTITGVANSDGTLFTFTVPNIPYGFYTPVVVQDGEVAYRQIDFVVTFPASDVPEIYRISPSIGKLGSTVTIYGNNFTRTNNIVEFGFDMGRFDGIPSMDGKTITFIMDPDTILAPSPNGLAEWPVNIRVINGNGISKEEGLFIIRL